MSVTITVAHLKGGAGKTTIAVSIAGELRRRNQDVALVDSDPQRSASHWAELGNLDFPVHEVSLEDISVSNWAAEVKRIEANFVVIDTPPNARYIGASLAVADILLVPCTPSGLDLEATEQMMSIVESVRTRRPSPLGVILVPNRVDRRTLEGLQLETELRRFGEDVGPPIGSRSAFVRAFATGRSIAESVPDQAADLEIRELCDRVEKMLSDQAGNEPARKKFTLAKREMRRRS